MRESYLFFSIRRIIDPFLKFFSTRKQDILWFYKKYYKTKSLYMVCQVFPEWKFLFKYMNLAQQHLIISSLINTIYQSWLLPVNKHTIILKSPERLSLRNIIFPTSSFKNKFLK